MRFENTSRDIISLFLKNGVSWTGNDLRQHHNANACSNIDFPLLAKNRRLSSVSSRRNLFLF